MQMHDMLVNLSLLTLHLIINDEERCWQLLTDLGVIPKRDAPPIPSHHHKPMITKTDKAYKLQWRWCCSVKACSKKLNPSNNTLLEDVKLDVRVLVAILAMNAMRVRMVDMLLELNNWRRQFFPAIGETSPNTVVDWNSMVREIGCVIMARNEEPIGHAGCTIEADETYLKRQKHNMGTRKWTTTIPIFGLACRETKQIRYFRVKDKSRRSLFPLMKKYIHPEVAVICTDGAAMYKAVDQLFPGVTHKVVNHRLVFVDPDDNTNHINRIEGENRHLKAAIKSRRTKDLVDQYIGWQVYYREHLRPLDSNGERMERILCDAVSVYPGCQSPRSEGWQRDVLTPEAMGIADLPCFQDQPVPLVIEDSADEEAAADDDGDDCDEDWSHEEASETGSASSSQTD